MRELFFANQLAGHVFENENIVVFFGQRHLGKEDLPKLFPQFRFHFIKQNHGVTCVKTSSTLAEADAHWTDVRGGAVPIQTADCLPVLVWDSKLGRVQAIHAGWRGLLGHIIPKSLATLAAKQIDLQIWIGPHIRSESFEVHVDVADQLKQNACGYDAKAEIAMAHVDPAKRFVNLTALAQLQLRACGIQGEQMWVAPVDTFRDSRYHSFRRDKSPGRQWSLIALK